MITDEELMELVQKRQIERFKNGELDSEILNVVLDYLEQNNDDKLFKYIYCNYDFRLIMQIVQMLGKIEKLQGIVINSKNAEYIYMFAGNAQKFRIKGVNIKLLEEAIIKTENAEYIYNFARFIDGTDILLLEEAIIKTGNNKDRNEKLRNNYFIYDFAIDSLKSQIKGANIKLLEDAIIKTGDAEYIYKFAINAQKLQIKEVNIKLLEEAIIKTKNAKYIYMFAKYIDGADIALLEKTLGEKTGKETDDYKYLNEFELDSYLKHLKEKQIVAKKQATENIISFAVKIIEEKQDREKILCDLIDNIENEDNKLKLKVYRKFLMDNKEDLLEALELDREYTASKQKKKEYVENSFN